MADGQRGSASSFRRSTRSRRPSRCGASCCAPARSITICWPSGARRGMNDVAIVRLEQLYPFPETLAAAVLAPYRNADVVWCQEEPENMGAWNFVDRRIETVLGGLDSKAKRPAYVGREAAASPATGSARAHARAAGGAGRGGAGIELGAWRTGWDRPCRSPVIARSGATKQSGVPDRRGLLRRSRSSQRQGGDRADPRQAAFAASREWWTVPAERLRRSSDGDRNQGALRWARASPRRQSRAG